MNHLLDVFKVLSDETRLRIAVLLAQGDLFVCQMSGILNVSQPKISKHLSKLRDLGFVKDNRQERYVYYQLTQNNPFLLHVLSSITDNLEAYPQLVSDQNKLADKEKYLTACMCKTESPH